MIRQSEPIQSQFSTKKRSIALNTFCRPEELWPQSQRTRPERERPRCRCLGSVADLSIPYHLSMPSTTSKPSLSRNFPYFPYFPLDLIQFIVWSQIMSCDQRTALLGDRLTGIRSDFVQTFVVMSIIIILTIGYKQIKLMAKQTLNKY